jgi:hypothetical protein
LQASIQQREDKMMSDDPQKRASKGGKARAASLSKEERKSIAVVAAQARWGKELPVAQHEGVLQFGDDMELPCAVLSDETRVLTETTFMKALGIYRSGALSVRRPSKQEGRARIPLSLAFKNLKPFIDKHLGDVHMQPLVFRTKSGNVAAGGIPATMIPTICEIWIDADRAGVLGPRQKIIAAKADILFRGLAHTGIIALVDEATGFQEARDRDALAKFLNTYIAKELRQWVSTFPRSFFQEICRLKDVPFPEDMRLPQYFGHIVNDLVYDRLAPGVKEELRQRNPIVGAKGRRRHKHFQWLTENIGNPQLLHHLGILEGLARGFPNGGYDAFHEVVNRVLPNHFSLPLFAQAATKSVRKALPSMTS